MELSSSERAARAAAAALKTSGASLEDVKDYALALYLEASVALHGRPFTAVHLLAVSRTIMADAGEGGHAAVH